MGTATIPRRVRAANVDPVAADTASATAARAGTGSTQAGSSASATSHEVNTPATQDARHDRHRSQPHTVVTGRSSRSAIRRNPRPAAANSSPAPTSAARSALLASDDTGNNTCIAPQDRHLRHPARAPEATRSAPAPAGQHSTAARAGQLVGHQQSFDGWDLRSHPRVAAGRGGEGRC
ncbi:hypothetical protein [Streptomyces sp. NPDC002676]